MSLWVATGLLRCQKRHASAQSRVAATYLEEVTNILRVVESHALSVEAFAPDLGKLCIQFRELRLQPQGKGRLATFPLVLYSEPKCCQRRRKRQR